VEDCDAVDDASAEVHDLPSSEQNSHSIELTMGVGDPNSPFASSSMVVTNQHTATRLPGR
jgi:hypothetical protein